MSADAHFRRLLDAHTDAPEVDEEIVTRYVENKIRDELPKDWRVNDPIELAETLAQIWNAYQDGDLDAEAMQDAADRDRESRECLMEDSCSRSRS
jgi:hypothetical protein